MIESWSLFTSPFPYEAHVAGMNCIGPCAPAVLTPATLPNFVSIRLIAAR